MSTLYENIRFYCDRAGISGAKLCADTGISKSTLTSLKNGRTRKIGTDNLSKMALRLGVSVDDLLGNDQKEKSPAPEGAELDAETIQLREIWDGADKEEREALLAMAKMLKARRNKR